jgi:hypothetical protein
MRCTNKTCSGKRCKNPTFSFGDCVVHANCAICLDRVQTDVIAKIRCGHVFHADCIYKHFDNDHKCPVCRVAVKLPKVSVFFDSSVQRDIITTEYLHRTLVEMFHDNSLPESLRIRIVQNGDVIQIFNA